MFNNKKKPEPSKKPAATMQEMIALLKKQSAPSDAASKPAEAKPTSEEMENAQQNLPNEKDYKTIEAKTPGTFSKFKNSMTSKISTLKTKSVATPTESEPASETVTKGAVPVEGQTSTTATTGENKSSASSAKSKWSSLPKVSLESFAATSAKEQRAKSAKAMRLEQKNLQLLERQKIIEERERFKTVLASLERDMIRAQAERQKRMVELKHESDKMDEQIRQEALKSRLYIQEGRKTLEMKKRDISLLNKTHAKKEQLLKMEISTKRAEVNNRINSERKAIKAELQRKRQELRGKALKNQAEAQEVRAKIRAEIQATQKELRVEKLNYKQRLQTMRVALFAERNRQSEELRTKKEAVRRKNAEQLLEAKQEHLNFIKERREIKANMAYSRIESRIKSEIAAKQKAQLQQEAAQSVGELKADKDTEIKLLKNQHDYEYTENRSEINEIFQEKITIDLGDSIDMEDAKSLIDESMIKDYEKKIEIKEFNDQMINYVKSFIGFEKFGEKRLKALEKHVAPMDIHHFKSHVYYAPLVKNYEVIMQTGDYVSFEEIVEGAYLIEQESELNRELITEKVRNIQKAILQNIGIKVGRYFIIPVRRNSIQSYVLTTEVKLQEQIFDERELFEETIARQIERIIDYKLSKGASIRILNGIMIDNHEGDLQIAIWPNIFNK